MAVELVQKHVDFLTRGRFSDDVCAAAQHNIERSRWDLEQSLEQRKHSAVGLWHSKVPHGAHLQLRSQREACHKLSWRALTVRRSVRNMSSPSALSAVARSLAHHRTRFEAFTRPATDLILEAVGAVREVVDLASGTGDPALALAAARPGARVLATDNCSELLAATEREAHARGLANLRILETDMHHLPLSAASVDLVTSRLGLQFAGDVRQALAEILRVLKPGGTTCHVAWGAIDQPLLRDMLPKGATFKLGEPGPFQFSQPGTLAKAFEDAGFVAVKEHTRCAEWTWHGDAESFSSFMQETSGAAPGATLAAFERHGALVFPVELHVVRAVRA